MREDLPFDYVDGSNMPNSEILLESWFIENPTTKDLVKSLTCSIPAETEKELIIVMKAPLDRPIFNLATFLSLKLPHDDRLRSIEVEKRLKSAIELEDIEIETTLREKNDVTKEIRVMMIGKL